MSIDAPPSAPKPDRRHPTRWEREKAAAGDPNAFENPDDPKHIGPWVLGETIGKGASGRVKIARHRVTGKCVAVKILPFGITSLGVSPAKAEKHRISVEREIVMMKLMEHPNIVRLYDVWEGRGNLYLVLEWIEGGELFDLIVDRGTLLPSEALGYFKQIIYGLSYCHAFSIAHRDLKPENILIHGIGNELVKIADWGMAAFQTPFAQLETSCGSPHYASPEVIRGEHYEGAKADIWSVGVVLFALLAGKLPFDDKDVPCLLNKVKAGVFEIPSEIHPKAADLIRRMLVVDVRERISMYDILNHPFLRYDTPGVYYVAPPSLTTLQAPIRSATDIDPDVLSSLRIIFGKHVSAERILRDLLLNGPNTAKAFYVLLLKFRERQLKNYSEDSAKIDCEPDLHPYLASRTRMLDYFSASTTLSAHPDSRYTSRNRPPRPHGSRSSRHSPPLATRSRLPVLSSNWPASVVSYPEAEHMPNGAPATSRPYAEMTSNAPTTSSTPPFNDEFPTPPGIARPATRRRGTAPMDLDSVQPARSQPRRRETVPIIPVSGLGLVAPAPILDSTPNMLFPMQRTAELPTSAPRPRPAMGSAENTTVPSTAVVGDLYAPTFAPIIAPRLHDPGAQMAMDDLVNRANILAARDNAEHLRREHMIRHVLSDTTSTHKRSMAEDRTPSSSFRPVLTQVKSVSRHSSIHGKENLPNKLEAPVRRRRSNEGPRRIPGFFKTPVFGSVNDSHRHTVAEENEKAAMKEMRRNKVVTPSIAKRSIIRKNRPANLDLRAALPSITPRPLPSVHSATSTPSTPLMFSPVVQEFRGWFSNLFQWKTPTRTLHSPLNCLMTRDEAAKLLREFGVSVMLEDTLGWGVLKCKMEEKFDAAGTLTQKQLRFRIEFHPYRVSVSVSPALDGAVPLLAPHSESQYVSTMTLIQERGVLSAFKNICEKLRTEWRVDALYCPDATTDSNMSSGGRSSHVTESISGFLLVQPASNT